MSEDAESGSRARVGAVLDDKWTLERLLGVGGMAAVYAALHRNGARAAVKVLHPDLSRNKEVRERFLREGYAANRVDHAGAVKVLDDDVIADGPDAGTAYLVMELLEGESLQDRLERGPPVGELEFLMFADSVLEVLEAAHARGVVHRDLKPENLFLVHEARDGSGGPPTTRVKVLDFGLARLLQGQAITSYGLALGTPSFMSPEQAAGRIDEIDGRTDLFALAATGFRLRTGRRIHEAANPVELVGKMASLAAPRIHSISPDASEPFARVIDRALEFRRDDRYENAAAMRRDVRLAISELDAGVAPTLLAVSAGAAPVEATIELSEGDLQASPAPPTDSFVIPRRRSVLPWVALLVFSGIGVKLFLDARSATSSAPRAPTIDSGAADATPSVAASPAPRSSSAGNPGPEPAPASALTSEVPDGAIAGSPTPLASGPPRSPPVPTPAASIHRSVTPTKVGPANVHKLPRKHRATGQKVKGANQ